MTDSAHICHALRCTVNTPPEYLMCREHWGMVPNEIRSRVWDAYREGQCQDKNPSRECLDAADEAIAAVDKRETLLRRVDRVAFDTETFLIGPGQIAPRLVCATFANRIFHEDAVPHTHLLSNGDQELFTYIDNLFSFAIEGTLELVFHNAAFDLAVVVAFFPELMPKVWEALSLGRIRDTIIREKLLNLATHGHLDELYLPDGAVKKIDYKLATLVKNYLGLDRSMFKGEDGAEDVWRLNYNLLDGIPAEKFPPDAAEYARQDASDTLLVCEAQDALAMRKFVDMGVTFPDGPPLPEDSPLRGKPFDVFEVEHIFVGVHFAAQLATCWGFKVDQNERARIASLVEKELSSEKLQPIIDAGILRPGEPERPWANGAKNADGSPRMVASVKPSINKKALIQEIENVCSEHSIEIQKTQESDRFPDGQTKTDADFIESISPLSPILGCYEHYQSLGKLSSTELPALKDVEYIYPNFNPMVETGRMSSYGSSKNRKPLYPSRNIQQVPRGFELTDGTIVEPRRCYLPRTPGWVLLSSDFSFLELVTQAQTAYRVLGYSDLRDLIIRGDDPHSFMGAQLAHEFDSNFQETCAGISEHAALYHVFKAMEHGDKEEQDFYKKWRSFGKICMLSLGGALGPEKLIAIARKQYKVIIASVEIAMKFKKIWLATFREMNEMIGPKGWISQHCEDEEHSDLENDRFYYWSYLGMLRRNCSYTSVRNGFTMQTPGAHAFASALFNVSRAVHDPTMNSILLGCKVLAPVHDEIILEAPDDQYLHERAQELSRLMREGLKEVCPDVPVKTECAAMRVWTKSAKPVYENGRLKVWEPVPAKEKQHVSATL